MFALLLTMLLLLRLPAVQRYVAQQAAAWLSGKLHTPVAVKGFSLSFLDKLSLDGVYIEDQNKDTLLYSGHLEIKITDWFIFKDEKQLHFLGLKDAYIYLNRPGNDPVWNYQFIANAFGSDNRTESPGGSELEFSIKKIELENVHFASKDKWIGEDNVGHIGLLRIQVGLMDRSRKQIIVDEISARDATYGLTDYKGGRPDSLRRKRSLEIDTTPFNPDKWRIAVKQLNIEGGHFFLDNPDKPEGHYGSFDEWKMDIDPIQLSASDINIVDDTLTGHLEHLSAKDRSGIEIKEMRAKVKVSPKISECRELYLVTNNSVLQDYYAMHYERFPDFTDYIKKVRMEGRFKNAKIAMNDIAFFAPEMKAFQDMEVLLAGKGGGTVEHLYADDVKIMDGKSELSVGHFTMNGLPDIENTDMSFQQSELYTSGANLLHYFPRIAEGNTINWLALQRTEASFDLIGGINDFNVKSSIRTGLGDILIDGALRKVLLPRPEYATHLNLEAFDIGHFLNTGQLGRMDGTFELNGNGFDPGMLQIKIVGSVKALETEHYHFHNAAVEAVVLPDLIEGRVALSDSNAMLDFEGRIGQLLTAPRADITADIRHLDLKAVGLLEEEAILSGQLGGHFEGIDIETMMGEAMLRQMTVKRDGDILDIDSIYLKSMLEDDIRYLYLGTNNISARLWGDYKILELPQTIQHFSAKYLPTYFKAPNKYDTEQLIYFDIASQNINDLLSVLNSDFALPQGGTVHGFLNSGTDVVALDAHLPKFEYKGFKMDSLFVKGQGNQDAFELKAGTLEAGYATNVFLKELDIDARLKNSELDFSISTATPEAFSNARLNGKGKLLGNGIELNVLPSKIYINNNNWSIPAGNAIVYADGQLNIRNFEINSDDQHIYINKNESRNDTARIDLVGIGIAPLSRLLQIDDVVSGGNISGSIAIEGILSETIVSFALQSDSVHVQKEPLQSLKVEGKYEQSRSMLYFDPGTGVFDKDGSLSVNGSWALGSANPNAMSGLVEFNNAKIAWLSPLLKGYVDQLAGRLTGTVAIKGDLNKLSTEGALTLQQIALRPGVLGERYTIKNGIIKLQGDEIRLGRLLVNDAQDNTAYLSGYVTHRNLLEYDFNAKLESEQLKVLNLNAGEGERYYGSVDAKVNATLTGPATDIRMQISLVPLPNSSLVIPLDLSSDVGTYNYIKFKRPDDLVPAWRQSKLKFSNKYNIRIDALINNDLSTNIIMDPKTNDELFSRGEGNIVMEIPSDGDIKLNGNYRIESGYYNFAFRQMQILNYNREFRIVPGSTIIWSGDIYDAHLNVTGITTVKARLYDLISNEINRINISPQELTDAQQPQMINVRLNAGNTLQDPDIDFKIELTENRSIGTYAFQKLERVNLDEAQLLNQVASLLLLDQFAPPEGFMNNTAVVSSGALNNVSDVISSVASSQLSNWANKIFGVNDLNIGVRYKNYNLNNSLNNSGTPGNIDLLNRNEAKVSVRKNFLNNRLLVDVGGVYDWGRPSQVGAGASYTSNLAGDFMVQYLIRRDGRVRFNIFRTSNYDALFQQNISRQGVGLSYRRSFSNFWELLGIVHSPTITGSDTEGPESTVDTAAYPEANKDTMNIMQP